MTEKQVFRVGSRKSALALAQTHLIIEKLKQVNKAADFEVVTMDTIGDKILDVALSKIGDKNLFTKELEAALLAKEVDFVVHSLKDMPSSLCSDFILACICQRIDKYDVAVFPKNGNLVGDCAKLENLPSGSVVGTSSVRRVSQLKRRYPHLEFKSVRGNLNTRLKKLDADGGEYSAIILAKAGLIRLEWTDRVGQELTLDGYAVGQGALACECRYDDMKTRALLASIHDEPSALSSICERSLMRELDGGCSTPVAVDSSLKGDVLTLRGMVLSTDGREMVEDTISQKLPRTDIFESPDARSKRQTDVNYYDDLAKRRKIESCSNGYKCLPSCHQGTSDQIFLGLAVHPICRTAIARMQVAKQIGQNLAESLLKKGAAEILDEIRKNASATCPLAAPTETRVQALLNQANGLEAKA